MDDIVKSSTLSSSTFIDGLNLMRQMGQAINATLEPSALIWEIYRQTHKVIPADIFTLSLLTDDPEIVDLFGVDKGELIQEQRKIGPLTQWVIENREPFLTSDDRIEPPPVVPITIETSIPDEPYAYIFVPLTVRDKVMGVISVQSYTPDAFNDVHFAMLSAIASHSAVVLENVRLLAGERKRGNELRGLERIGYELAGITDLSAVLKEIAIETKDLLKADSAAIYAYNERKGQFRQPAFTMLVGEAEPTQRARPPRAKGLTIRIVQRRSAIITHVLPSGEIRFEEIPLGRSVDLNARHGFEFADQDTSNFLHKQGIRSSIGFPLRAGNDMVGVLYINYLQPHEFGRDELRTIARLAQHAATAIQRANIYDEIRALHEASQALTGQIEMKAVMAKLFEYGHEVLGADVIMVFPYHAATDEFDLPPLMSGEVYEQSKIAAYGIREDDIIRQVVKEATVYFTQDAQTDERFAGPDPARRATRFVGRERIVSSAAVPLKAENEGVGALFFNYRTKQRFGSHQRLLIETFAAYVATAIQRARLIYRRVDELRALAKIDQTITGGSLQGVLDAIIRSTCQIVGVGDGTILLAGESGEYLYPAAMHGTAWQTGSPKQIEIGKVGVIGWVAQNRRAARIGNVRTEDPWKDIYIEVLPGVQSELAVPILDHQENLVGVINLDSWTANAFSADDERLLVALAEQAYIAIRNQRQFEAEQRARQELELLNEIDRALSSTLDLEEVLQLIADKSRTLISAPVFHVMLYDERRGDLYLAAARGTSEELKHSRQSIDVGIVGQVARTCQSLRINDVTLAPWNQIYLPVMADTRSELAVPMIQDDKLVGVLNLQSPVVEAFSEDDQRLLKSIASRAVIAIQNSRLYEFEQRSRRVLDILGKVDQAIISQAVSRQGGEPIDPNVELSNVLELLLNLGLDAVNAPTGHISLYDKVQGDLYIAAERGGLPQYKRARQKLGEGIVGKVAHEKRSIRVADVTEPPWNETYLPFISDACSELAVPLLRDGRLIGVLNAESPHVGAFGPDDEDLLETLSGQAVIAYQTAERYQALQTLREVNQLLASEHDPDKAIKLILRHACAFIKAEWGNLRLYESDGHPIQDYVVVESALGAEPTIRVIDLRQDRPEAWSESRIVDWVAQAQQPYRSRGNVQDDPRFRGHPGLDIRSEMAAPLIVGQELVGVLNLESEREDAFDEDDEERLLDISAQAAIAVRNAQSFEAIQQARARFAALNEVGTQIINAPLDEQTILEIVLTAGLERTGAFHAIAWQPDEEGKRLLVRMVRGEQSGAQHEPAESGMYVNDLAWQERRLILVDDVEPPEGIQYPSGVTSTRSILVVPMVAGDEYFGNLDFRHKEAHGFKSEEVTLIKGLSTQAASAIKRVQRERELEEMRQSERGAQIAASLGLAAGELAHRIGNWLGPVGAYIKAIKKEIGQDYVEANRLLDSILENVKRMLFLSQQLREKLKDEIDEQQPKKIFPAELILAETRRFRQPPPTVKLSVVFPATKLYVRANEGIFEAFTNICANAYEALEATGGTIRMSARQVSGWVEFQISDDGPGIEENKQSKIFNLFYSTKKNSLGFGLWSAKQRVLANGGQIYAKSKVGQGATFIIRLPATASDGESPSRSMTDITDTKPAEVAPASKQAVDKTASADMKMSSSQKSSAPSRRLSDKPVSAKGWVLVVEDMENWQEILSRLLLTDGFQVDVVGGLAEAIERLNARMYHLVISDLRLEDWDEANVEGMTILEELDRRYGGRDGIVTIMCSAYGTREDLSKAFRQHKVFDFILKEEFDESETLAVVRKAFEKEVRMNPDLGIILEGDLTFENMVAGIVRDGKRVKKEDPDFDRLIVELADLFRRLFNDYARIVVRRVTSGRGKSGVVAVEPFSKDAYDEAVIVKYGDYREIDREYRNYEEFVKGKVGTRSTNVLNLRRTPLLGGIVYKFIGTRVEQAMDFASFYRSHPAREINAVLNDLFKVICANWYAARGVVQYSPLNEVYRSALQFDHEQMLEAFEANFPYYLGQTTLTFRDLPGVHVPNPAYATKGRTLSRQTFLCTTHGDLNANNVLIDTERHTWLIDFYRTGKSHILRDCVQLETVVKFILLEEEDLAERYGLDKALAGMSHFKEVDGLRFEAPNEPLAKAFEVCRKLRQIARDLVQPNDDFSEYEIGLLYCTMNTQRFYSLPKVNRLHALLAAGMLCEKLGLNPR